MKIKRFYIVLMLTMFVGSCFGQLYKQEEEVYRHALKLFYIDKDYHTLIKYCEEINSTKENLDILSLLGRAYIEIDKLPQAEHALNNASRVSGGDPMAMYRLGNLRIRMGKFDEAISNYGSAIRKLEHLEDLNVKLAPFIEAKGRAYRVKGRYDIAKGDLQESIGLGSKYAIMDFASLLLQKNETYELGDFLKNIKTDGDFGFQRDEKAEDYLSLMETYAQGQTENNAIEKVNRLIGALGEGKKTGFNVIEYDYYYLKYRMLQQIGRKNEAYYVLKALNRMNNLNPHIRDELNTLRIELGIDSSPPEIKIFSPIVDDIGRAIIKQMSDSYEIIGSIEDECEISELAVTINSRAINSIEEDGVFVYPIELHPGDNPVVIEAIDGEDNLEREEFVFQFETTQTMSASTTVIQPEDIAKIRLESTYHAILISQGNYYDPNFVDLKHPVQDARNLRQILTGLYGFSEKNITVLENNQRSDLLSALDSVSAQMTVNDNLLVFYAGHGDVKKINGEITGGYIIPSYSKYKDYSTYISSYDLFRPFKSCQAKHILFVVDACFAGSLYRSTNDILSNQPYLTSRRYSSRNLISSGNLEEVPDQSQFIQNLFNCLERSNETVLGTSTIFQYIQQNNSTRNNPQWLKIRNYGDKGGMFHFLRDPVSD